MHLHATPRALALATLAVLLTACSAPQPALKAAHPQTTGERVRLTPAGQAEECRAAKNAAPAPAAQPASSAGLPAVRVGLADTCGAQDRVL